jgi:L-rhamnose mutarotase
MLNLKNSPKLIAEYRKVHSREKAWPEIRAGIRSVGILEMEIYILGSRLFMIVETPLDFDWETAMGTDFLIYLDKQNGKNMYLNFKSVCLQALLQKNGN